MHPHHAAIRGSGVPPETPSRHRRLRSLPLGAAWLLSGAAALAGADDTPTPPTGVKLTLAADTTAAAPGEPFRAGVFIEHQPGFHTYWKAPGIVGLPTRVEWLLPDGWAASDLQWPAPESTHMFEYRAYGYERDTLLFATLTPPASGGDGEGPHGPVVLRAQVTWMACAETCHPGTLVLELTVPSATPVATPANHPDWYPRFEAAAARVPKTVALPGARAALDAPGTITLTFEAEPGGDFDGLEFLSEDNLSDPNQPQRFSPGPPGRLTLTLMPNHPKTLPHRLRGLLHRPAGWPAAGGLPFIRIDLPLVSDAGTPTERSR
jgi:thiol:disulfide interchange protein DsbD